MSQQLRKYQRECVRAVHAAIDEGYSRILYTCATGTGKTSIMAELIRDFIAQDRKVLVLAHRTELISQAFGRIKDHCHLTNNDIGMEIAESKAYRGHAVIVGSVQTCYRPHRLPQGWEPGVIICDESHRASADTYRRIVNRFGVMEGRCLYIGCTATAKRTDRQSLYAIGVDDEPVMLERKNGPPKEADPAESVFEKHCYDYSIMDAIEDGFLVPIRGHTAETDTDLNGVKTSGGDFVQGQLEGKVDNNERTKIAINAWKQIAEDRQTIVFCAGVKHAHHSAKLWQDAGYTAEAVDGETDHHIRADMFDRFKKGDLQVLCNVGVATEGTDLPTCSCVVHLRPTKSWTLYMQASGRGTRPWPGLLDDIQDEPPEVRKEAIANSPKKDCLILDLVDLYDKVGSLCSVPSILDLPVKLDLQGHSVTEAKKMLDEFEEVKERVIGECPTTYEELKVRLHKVNLMLRSKAVTKDQWKQTDWGYTLECPPGYGCDLVERGDSSYCLEVTNHGKLLLRKIGKSGADMEKYLDHAAGHAAREIEKHMAENPRSGIKMAWDYCTPKQLGVMRRNGHTEAELRKMPYGRAKILIGQYLASFYGRK